MIRKTRIKFVAVTMILLTIVILSVAAATLGINYRRNQTEIESKLKNRLESSFDHRPSGDFDDARSFLLNVNVSNGYVLVSGVYDVNYFTEEDIKSIVLLIVQSGASRGRINDLYYAAEARNANVVIAGIDRAVEEKVLFSVTRVTFFATVGGLIVLFAAVWGLSFWIIKPVEDAFSRQKMFISDASHELKTPLTIISANADVLSEENGGSEWAENIKFQTKRMTVLVNDMLSLARLEENPNADSKVEMDLSATAENCVLPFEAIAYETKKSFTASFTKGIVYTGIEEDVRKLCNLLIDNALKYSESYVDVKLCRIKSGRPLLEIKNDGCQIESHDKEKIFRRFYRGDGSRDRATGGSGLGLAVVKALADKNKWKISVDCKKGGDMDITIEF